MSTLGVMLARRAMFAVSQRAAFSTSIARRAGKESALHSEGRAEEIERKIQDQLNKQKDGKGHWEESLASDSESSIKADRAETGKSTQEHIKKLQEETKKVAGQ